MSTLQPVRFALPLMFACSKSHSINAKPMTSAAFLTRDPTFGIHSRETSGTAQLFHLLKLNWKPSSFHSALILTNFDSQPPHYITCVCACVCACAWVNLLSVSFRSALLLLTLNSFLACTFLCGRSDKTLCLVCV